MASSSDVEDFNEYLLDINSDKAKLIREEIILKEMRELLEMTKPPGSKMVLFEPDEEQDEDFELNLHQDVIAAQKAENDVVISYQQYISQAPREILLLREVYITACVTAIVDEMKELQKNENCSENDENDKFKKYFYEAYFNVMVNDLASGEFHFEAVVYNSYEEEVADYYYYDKTFKNCQIEIRERVSYVYKKKR